MFNIGDRVGHEKYGNGTIIESNDISISNTMISWDNPNIVDMYICFDGILLSELHLII